MAAQRDGKLNGGVHVPIIGKDENVRIEYTIPTEIDNRIPEHFYPALAGELFSICGPRVFEPCDGVYDFGAGTHGWYEAIRATCRKLGLDWLLHYYETLPWYDSDLFDGIIESRVSALLDDAWPNTYYEHLLAAGGSYMD